MPNIDEVITFGDGGKSEKLSRWNNRVRELNRKKTDAGPDELKKINDEIADIHGRISKLQSEQTEPIMTPDEDLIEDVELNALLDQAKVAEAAALEEAKACKKEAGCEDDKDDKEDEEEMDEAKADPVELKKQLDKYKANLKFAKDDKAKATIQNFIDEIQGKLDGLKEAFGKKDDDSDDDADGKDDDNDGKADDDDNEPDDDDSKGEDKDKPKPAFLKNIKKEGVEIDEENYVAEESELNAETGIYEAFDNFAAHSGHKVRVDTSEGGFMHHMYFNDEAKAKAYSDKKKTEKDVNSSTVVKMTAGTPTQQKTVASQKAVGKIVAKHGFERSTTAHNQSYQMGGAMSKHKDLYHKKDSDGKITHTIEVDHNKETMNSTGKKQPLSDLASHLDQKYGKDKAKKEPSVKKESFIDDMNSIVEEADGLSEDFKEKAGTLFEVALNTRVREEKDRLQEEFDNKIAEETAAIRESLEEKVDNYLTYAVESWVEDNKIAIESGLRTEVAESFISALKNVFVEHYIEVPETKKDVVSELETKLVSVEEALCASGKQAAELAEQVEKLVREKILAEAAESLADTQGARLQALAEDVEFVDEETFRKKVATIKECYFQRKGKVIEEEASASSYETKEIIVEDSEKSAELSPTMQSYVSALARVNKANTFTR
jgi:hypothetical protein